MRTSSRRRWLSILLFACACQPTDAPGTDGGDIPPDPLLVARPFDLLVPAAYDASRPTPFLILLHGYGFSGVLTDAFFGMKKFADENNILYAYPDGTLDSMNRRFWNATDGCCNLFGAQVDDVAYLKAIIKDTKARYNVDPKRIFLVGHSNGGFMSYRMACDAADEIAAIVSLAGATWKDPPRCKPGAPVAVLQVHGDMDDIISYNGGRFYQTQELYPSAHDTVAQWAQHNGCTGQLTASGPPLDADTGIAGAETRVERYAACPPVAVELWTVQGGGHFPKLSPSWPAMIYGFLTSHLKP